TEPNQQINGIDLTGLPDGLVTLTVFLANPNGEGIEVTDTVTLDTSLPVDCDGGNSAHPFDSTEPTIFCDEIDVDLNDYLTSTDAPAGTVLTWGVDADTNDESTHLGGSRAGSSGLYYGFYYDAANNCSSPYVEVLLVSNDTPLIDLDVTQGGSICEGDSLTLTAAAEVEDASVILFRWYNAPIGGELLGTGATFTTGPLTETTS